MFQIVIGCGHEYQQFQKQNLQKYGSSWRPALMRSRHLFILSCGILSCGGRGAGTTDRLSKQEKSILEDIRDLRNLSEGNRAKTTRQLALKIRQLPAGTNKQRLAVTLASRSTEGDAGKDTLQEVATTLVASRTTDCSRSAGTRDAVLRTGGTGALRTCASDSG